MSTAVDQLVLAWRREQAEAPATRASAPVRRRGPDVRVEPRADPGRRSWRVRGEGIPGHDASVDRGSGGGGRRADPHYYRNKEGLFAAPLEFPPGTAGLVAQALTGPSGTQAERLTRAYLGLWEDDATGRQLRSLARSAFGDERARLSVEEALLGTVSDPATSLVLEGRRIGVVLAMAQLLGVALQRHLLPGSPTSTLDLEALIARVAHAIAVHLATADP